MISKEVVGACCAAGLIAFTLVYFYNAASERAKAGQKTGDLFLTWAGIVALVIGIVWGFSA